MKISSKLIIAFGASLLVIVAVISLNYGSIEGVERQFDTYSNELSPNIETIDKFIAVNKELRLTIEGVIHSEVIEQDKLNRINSLIEIELPHLNNKIYSLQEELASEDFRVAIISEVISNSTVLINRSKSAR